MRELPGSRPPCASYAGRAGHREHKVSEADAAPDQRLARGDHQLVWWTSRAPRAWWRGHVAGHRDGRGVLGGAIRSP